MPAEEEKCLLCHDACNRSTLHASSGGVDRISSYRFVCPRCGRYVAEKFLVLANPDTGPVPELSGMAREMHERGEQLQLTRENYEGLKNLAPRTVSSKAKRLLHAIARSSKYFGHDVELLYPRDYPLGYSKHRQEFSALIDYLVQSGLLVEKAGRSLASKGNHIECLLTARGWSEIEADKVANVQSDKAFVAMWFNPTEMDDAYYHGIKLAIEDDAGYRSIRVDAVEHAGKIDDRIIAEIRESRFLVADFTGQRGGVYFEAGFGMGLGLPVIWTCREDEIGKVHFDTRQYNHVTWKDPAELREKLAVRIRAIVGKGPHPIVGGSS